MKLRKPCEHGVYDGHGDIGSFRGWCPGGEFLPDDAIVIEEADEFVRALGLAIFDVADFMVPYTKRKPKGQVGEPG